MSDFNMRAEEEIVKNISFQIDSLRVTIKREADELDKVRTTQQNTQSAQEILQLLAQAVQQQAHTRVAGVVTSCLQAVFDDPYEFKIVFERKRGRTEASLRFVRGDLEVDPLTASGGGMVDVAAFALRVACLVLHRPKLRRVLVLDEPFRFVSAEYQDNVRSMLEQLSKDMGVQIIFVTHNEAFVTGQVVRL